MEHTYEQDSVPDEVLKRENYRISNNFRWLGSGTRESQELYLTVCGTERCRPDKSFGPLVRRDCHAHVVLHGTGKLQMNGTVWTVSRGQVFVTFPGVEVFYQADAADPWYYTWVSFSGTRAAALLAQAGITADHPVRACGAEPEQYLAIAEKILNHHQLTLANEMVRTSALYEFLALLLSSQGEKSAPHPYDYPADVYVNAAQEYIRHNYASIQVSDLAEYIGISRSYLTRIFQERLHTTPKEQILDCRLTEAARLLRTTARSVQEISGQVGYTNPFSFSQIFRSRYGVSPRGYRSRLAGARNGEEPT